MAIHGRARLAATLGGVWVALGSRRGHGRWWRWAAGEAMGGGGTRPWTAATLPMGSSSPVARGEQLAGGGVRREARGGSPSGHLKAARGVKRGRSWPSMAAPVALFRARTAVLPGGARRRGQDLGGAWCWRAAVGSFRLFRPVLGGGVVGALLWRFFSGRERRGRWRK